jgi:acyl dehydratase
MEAKKLTRAEWNNLIEQLLERDKKLVGTVFLPPKPGPNVPYHVPTVPPDRMVTARMIHDYAMGRMGDPDPLYTDPDYGKYTRYGSMIAPPTFLIIFGLDVPRLNGPDFPGANEFQGGTSYDYSANKVIRPGDEIRTIGKYLGYKEITDPSKPYRLFRLQSKTTCYNQRDEVVCIAIGTAMFQFVYPGDIDAMSGTLFKGREKKPHYTKEQLDMIHQWYEEELEGKHQRGAEIRYWEDVAEGEELPPVIEGPLQVTDAVAAISTLGWGGICCRVA